MTAHPGGEGETGRTPLRVLFFEDETEDIDLSLRVLESAQFDVVSDVAVTLEDVRQRLRSSSYDVILSDYRMPGATGMDCLAELKAAGMNIPFLLVTGALGEEKAVECLKDGVADYVLKDRLARLPVAVRGALEEQRLRAERTRAEDALRRSEGSYRSLIQSAPCGILRLSAGDGRLLEGNAALSEMLGYDSSADLLKGAAAGGIALGLELLERLTKSGEQEGQVIESEIEWRHKDGRPLILGLRGRLLRDESGIPACLEMIAENVTERRRAEEALRSSEEKYRLLVASIPDIVWVADELGHLVFVTPNIETITGYAPEEIYESGVWFDRIHPEDVEPAREAYREFLTSGPTFTTEHRIQRKDGPWIWLEARAISSYESEGKRLTIGVASDITARKQAAEELRKAKEAAEAGSRAKSRFLANMSHEIRTPMNGVIGMSRLLLDTKLSDEQRHYAEIACASGETLLALINELLDFSKIEAGKMLLETVDFDLRVVLEGLIELLALPAERKGLELTCLVTPETPSYLRGDPVRLRQVLVNLATNAVKFTERGQVAIRVEPAQQNEGHATLRFYITDSGIGIKKDRAAALFSPFVQADESTTRRFGGTGLGLAISRQLVELMGGEIGFESEEGKGSTFWFTAELEKQPASREAVGDQGTVRYKEKVLVVDDSTPNRSAVSTLLRSLGCRPSAASDGATALALLRDAAQAGDPFDVVLLDQGRPGAGGEELAARIAADPRIPGTALLLMAPWSEADSNAGLPEGAASLFAARVKKPVLETRLREALKASLCSNNAVKNAAPMGFSGTRPHLTSARSPARILLAEDNQTNQEVAVAILARLGYTVNVVSNGSQAVEALKTAAYDVVLMDCEMPELDGYEATRLIRDPRTGALDPKVPIIAVTAAAMPADRAACLQAGMDDYLSKPIDPKEMAQRLARWLSRREPAVTAGDTRVANAADTEVAFDQAGLLKRLMGNQALAERVAKGFLKDIPVQLRNLRKHLEEGDATSARRQAHTLKGAAATVSANALRAVAFEAEQAAGAGKLRDVVQLLPCVEQQVERFKSALERAGWA